MNVMYGVQLKIHHSVLVKFRCDSTPITLENGRCEDLTVEVCSFCKDYLEDEIGVI